MLPAIWVWFVIVSSCLTKCAESFRNNEKGIRTLRREKRGVIPTSGRQLGRQAIQMLLESTKQTKDMKYFREYLKYGNYRRAFDDFNSVRPNHVKEKMLRSGVHVKIGEVGDRIITLTSRGPDGKPVIDIDKRIVSGGDRTPALERIIYVE